MRPAIIPRRYDWPQIVREAIPAFVLVMTFLLLGLQADDIFKWLAEAVR